MRHEVIFGVERPRPWAGPAPPGAVYYFAADRKGEHVRHHLRGSSGILQADASPGFNDLYVRRADGTAQFREAACWAHLWMSPLLQGCSTLSKANTAAAVIYPACHGDAPRAAGLDGQTMNRLPITIHEFEARCARRASPAPVCPVSPSCRLRPSHPRQPEAGLEVESGGVSSCAAPGPHRFRRSGASPRRPAPSCWRSRPRRRSRVGGRAAARTTPTTCRASA